jgi:hypothetical protein
MSVFSKLAFWKKDDDLDFDKIADKDMGATNPFAQNLPSDQTFGNEPFDAEHESPGMTQTQPFGSSAPQRSPIYPQQSAPSVQSPAAFQSASNLSRDRELELINSKLDTIKVMLNSMDQRLSNMERGAPKPPQRLW